MTTEQDTARDQAKAQLDNIIELLEWLDHANECDGEDCELDFGSLKYLMTDFDLYHDTEAAQEAIHENALDVEVNYGWHSVTSEQFLNHHDVAPEGFRILLCTGGPAVRVAGELFDADVVNARIQFQDWGTPWTDLEFISNEADEALLRYAQQFYFGG